MRFAFIFSLRTPSCCIVDVVNGAGALRLRCFDCTELTTLSRSRITRNTSLLSISLEIVSFSSPLCVTTTSNCSFLAV